MKKVQADLHLCCALTAARFSHDLAYKWVFKRDSLCIGNWPIN